MDPFLDSSSSSDNLSEDGNGNLPVLADLLWHKVRNTTKSDEPQDKKSSSQPSSSSTKRKSRKQFQVDIGNLLSSDTKGAQETQKQSSAKMTSKKKPQEKSDALPSLIQKRIEKDLKKVKVKTEPSISEWQRKKNAKLERSQWSLGKEGWGSMRTAELTEERKQDLMVLNMRSTIDPTRHYKHNDVKTPKFFQIGTVQEDHYSFYHDRIPKKKRKRTLVEELMADQEFKRKLKKQYHEVQATKSKGKAVFQGRAPRKIKRKK